MKEPDYFRGSFRELRQEERSGEKRLIAKALFAGAKADYTNTHNLSTVAYNARRNANDLYALVMEKYVGKEPVYIPDFEVLVALISLSSELYLKCLIYHYQLNAGNQIKGRHDLEYYFNMLTDDIQLDLKTIDPEFDKKMREISNYFNEFRYSYENNVISSIDFAFSLAKKLNQKCNSIKIDRPPEIICSKNHLLIRHGDRIIWDSAKKYDNGPIVSLND